VSVTSNISLNGSVTENLSVIANLNANGNSPAQFGFRANDANHVPIFDSLGLIAVMSSLGSATATNQTVSAATPTLITGTAVTFSLTRQSSVIIFYIANCSESSTGAANAQILSFIDGVDQTSGGNPGFGLAWAPTVAGAQTSSAWYSKVLAAGSHTADCRGFVSGTTSLSVLGCQCSVYLQGT